MKIYWNVCSKCRRFKNPKKLYILKRLDLSIVYSKCGHENYLKEKIHLKYYKVLVYLLI